jgi:hypothetical protein
MSAPDGAFRRALWRALGADDAEAEELCAYAASPVQDRALETSVVPLPEAPGVEDWARYAEQASSVGAVAVLRRVFVQLRFPVQAGMSQAPAYLAATRRGELPPETQPAAVFAQPAGLHIFLHPTPAGRVPVVVAAAREDFETLVQAVTRRNEPDAVLPSMGACMIAGYNNWERVAALRAAYLAEHPEDWNGAGWAAAFREIVPRKELYQDRFMLLSSGPYSATPAEALGLDARTWSSASAKLRLEHECTHFFMRQAFGAMRKSLLDELVADYMGLIEALGEFRLDAFLTFMGLEAHPGYRSGGRFQNYTHELSEGAVAVLREVVVRAAQGLARCDPARGRTPLTSADKARLVTAVTRVGLEGLASPDVERLLPEAIAEAARVLRAANDPS